LAGLNDAVVIAESGLAATAAASVMTLAAGRPRPFLYGTKAPLSERNGADAGLSFLSSHAAVSFAIATSTLVAMRRLHPHSRANWIVLGVGGAIASFVATARVLGGMHFISDVVGGAVVGSSLGSSSLAARLAGFNRTGSGRRWSARHRGQRPILTLQGACETAQSVRGLTSTV